MTLPRTQPTKKALSKKALPQHLIDVTGIDFTEFLKEVAGEPNGKKYFPQYLSRTA